MQGTLRTQRMQRTLRSRRMFENAENAENVENAENAEHVENALSDVPTDFVEAAFESGDADSMPHWHSPSSRRR